MRLKINVDPGAPEIYGSLSRMKATNGRGVRGVPAGLPAMLVAAVGIALAVEPPPPQPRVWKPVAEWYPFDGEKMAGNVVPASIEQSEMRMAVGDDPRWSQPSFDDSRWPVADDRYEVLKKDQGVFWVRLRTRSRGDADPMPSLVSLTATAASEAFWDGVLVHRSGAPGASRAAEVAGPLFSLFEIPRALLGPGEHLIALRMSTYHFNRPDTLQRIVVLNVRPDLMALVNEQRRLYPAMAIGALVVTGAFVLVIWLTAVRLPALLAFAGLCMGGASIVGLSLWRYVYPFPYSWSYPLWCASQVASVATAGCMVAFAAIQLGALRARYAMGAFVLVEGALAWWNGPVPIGIPGEAWRLDPWSFAFLAAIGLGVWHAARERGVTPWLLCACLALSLCLYARDPVNFARTHFLATILPTLFGFLVSLAATLRRGRREAEEAKLSAARLEIDLLKKSLQPHFLMNTLTTLSQIVEEEPRVAVRLIDDLAQEFRALGAIAGLRSIPLSRELELCETHLRVMSMRTERSWRLVASVADVALGVPPALFLTLIENGFSHQRPINGATTFTLRSDTAGGRVRYTFVSPGTVSEASGARTGGIGLRYVRVRLEEGWPGRWRLEQREVPGGWETVIDLEGSGPAGGGPS